MKKLLLTSLLTITAAVAFGQGTVYFANDTLTLPGTTHLVRFAAADTPGNVFALANAPAVGTNFFVQLYYGASTITSPDDSSLVAVTSNPAKLRGSTTTAPGVWSSGGARTLTGFDYASGSVALVVRVWDSIDGTKTYANTTTTRGESALFLYTLPSSASAPAGDFNMVNFGGVMLQVVPEPSTIALAGLGAAAFLIFRRRR